MRPRQRSMLFTAFYNKLSYKQCAILCNMTMMEFIVELKNFKGHINNLNRYLVIKVFPKKDVLTQSEFEFIDK